MVRDTETNQKSAHVLIRSLSFIAGVPWSRGQSYRLNYTKKTEDRCFIAKDQLDLPPSRSREAAWALRERPSWRVLRA
jgi:hypothetical protein